MSEHTPGPWNREWIAGALRHICRNVDSDAFCGPIPEDANTPSYYTPGDVDLITAAPETREQRDELLAACEAVCEILRHSGQATRSARVRDLCRAAIAKARGNDE